MGIGPGEQAAKPKVAKAKKQTPKKATKNKKK